MQLLCQPAKSVQCAEKSCWCQEYLKSPWGPCNRINIELNLTNEICWELRTSIFVLICIRYNVECKVYPLQKHGAWMLMFLSVLSFIEREYIPGSTLSQAIENILREPRQDQWNCFIRLEPAFLTSLSLGWTPYVSYDMKCWAVYEFSALVPCCTWSRIMNFKFELNK